MSEHSGFRFALFQLIALAFTILFGSVAPADAHVNEPQSGKGPKTVVDENSAKRIAALRANLFAGESSARADAAEELGRIGPAAAAAVPDLLKEAFQNSAENANAAFAAWDALDRIGPAAFPELLKILKTGKLEERTQVIDSMRRLYRPGHPALDAAICDALRDKENGLFQMTANVLMDIPAIDSAMPILMAFLRDENPKYSTHTNVIQAIGTFGTKASPAIPYLDRLVRNPKSRADVRLSALESLSRVGAESQSVADRLNDVLIDASNDIYLRAAAAKGIGISMHGQRHLQVLMRVAIETKEKGNSSVSEREKERTLRAAALEAAANQRPGKEGVDAFARLFSSEDEESTLKLAALRGLGKIGHEAATAAPVLLSALGDQRLSDGFLNREYFQTIIRILGRQEAERMIRAAASHVQDRVRRGRIIARLEAIDN